jgi:hypothetical protein
MKAVGRCNVSGDGRILDVVFTGGAPFTAGFGYDAAPTMTFTPSVTGMGSGAEGTAIIENGSVKNVVMTNQGSGYLGKNYPAATGFGIKPVGNVWAIAGKSYIRDLYFGTGMRTVQ